jgi:hypothetical protein
MNRTLVCVLAETRAHRLTWKGFKKNLLDAIDADLALCIAVPEDYDYANPYWQHATYKWVVPEYADWGDAFDKAQALELKRAGIDRVPSWRRLMEIKDQWLGGVRGDGQHRGSAGILLYFRWALLQYLVRENIFAKYDRVVVTRSDFIWEVPHPRLELLDENAIWAMDGEGWGGVSDRHTVLSRHNYQDVLGVFIPALIDPDSLYARMQQWPTEWNLEKFLAFSLLPHSRRRALRYFPYCAFSAREWGGSSSWRESLGTWSDERGCYIKYASEFNAANALKAMLRGPEDWRDILRQSEARGFNAFVLDANGRAFARQDDGFHVTEEPLKPGMSDARLFIDYADGRGRLYAGRATLGEFAREALMPVELTPADDGLYRITNERGALYLGGDDKLGIAPADHSLFRICCRYLPGGIDNNLVQFGADGPTLQVVGGKAAIPDEGRAEPMPRSA